MLGNIKSTDSKPPFVAADYVNDGKIHVLLAATGSVATIKIPLIAEKLTRDFGIQLSIRLVITPSASQFLQGQSEEQPSLSSIVEKYAIDGLHEDHDEWAKPWVRGDSILHIELRRWAHVMVVAPLSANSLAAMVNGSSHGLVLSVLRAWDTEGWIDGPIKLQDGSEKKKAIFVAPAMNTAMWRHPVTRNQMSVLQEWQKDGWVKVLKPMEKTLACGDIGDGAMMDWREIVGNIEEYLHLRVPGIPQDEK